MLLNRISLLVGLIETGLDYGLKHLDNTEMMLGVDAVVFAVESVWRNYRIAWTDDTWSTTVSFQWMPLGRRVGLMSGRLDIRRSCIITVVYPSTSLSQ